MCYLDDRRYACARRVYIFSLRKSTQAFFFLILGILGKQHLLFISINEKLSLSLSYPLFSFKFHMPVLFVKTWRTVNLSWQICSHIGNDFPLLFIHLLFIHIATMGRNCLSSVNLSLSNKFDEDLVSSQFSLSISTHCKWWYWSYFSFLHKRGVVLWVCSEFKARLSRSWFHSRLVVFVGPAVLITLTDLHWWDWHKIAKSVWFSVHYLYMRVNGADLRSYIKLLIC